MMPLGGRLCWLPLAPLAALGASQCYCLPRAPGGVTRCQVREAVDLRTAVVAPWENTLKHNIYVVSTSKSRIKYIFYKRIPSF